MKKQNHTVNGRLSYADFTALVAQREALLPLASNAALAALLDAVMGKLDAHYEAMNQIDARHDAILASVKAEMIRYEDAGWNYPLTLTLNHDGTVVGLV